MTLRRQLLLVFIWMLPFLLGEAYRFFGRELLEPWISGEYHFKYTMQRYVDELADRIVAVMYIILALRGYRRIPLVKLAVILNLVYAAYDVVTFMYNRSSSEDYYVVYAAIGLVGTVLYAVVFMVPPPKIQKKKQRDKKISDQKDFEVSIN